MKLSTKSWLVPGAIAASIAVAVPAYVGADFDLTGLNNQVQNHESRITTLESATPTPGPVSPTAQSPQTDPVTVGGFTGSAVAPAPSAPPIVTEPAAPTVVEPTATPAPLATPYYCPQPPPGPDGRPGGNVSCGSNNPTTVVSGLGH